MLNDKDGFHGRSSLSSTLLHWQAAAGVESFSSRLRDELTNRELFLSVNELRYVADHWRTDYNHYRSYSSLDYVAPAAFAAMCLEQDPDSLRLIQDKENCCEELP